ncbi:MAG: hypothetical protein IIX36_03030, partial [Clostridia bacterium]|nr:hypothetical protein [Clostridia bacterium]
ILVAVLVNGYTDGSYEWVSNFNVGTDGLHDGFEKAAEEVKTKITEYIEAQNLSLSKVKIWITGHSRGAAVTGITAKMLNDIKSIGMADVYAYGFATPNGVPEEKAEIDKNKNIFNIVNEGDFVPYVVPSDWGFVKYGLTYKIATETDSKVKSAYKALVKRSYGGLTIKERTKIIDAFCLYSPDRTAYNAAKYASPKDFGRALGLSMSDNVLKHGGEIATLLGKCGVNDVTSLKVLGEMVENGMVKTKIHEAHGMETYLAMVYYGERKLINRT